MLTSKLVKQITIVTFLTAADGLLVAVRDMKTANSESHISFRVLKTQLPSALWFTELRSFPEQFEKRALEGERGAISIKPLHIAVHVPRDYFGFPWQEQLQQTAQRGRQRSFIEDLLLPSTVQDRISELSYIELSNYTGSNKRNHEPLFDADLRN